jgi:hypothetical protein
MIPSHPNIVFETVQFNYITATCFFRKDIELQNGQLVANPKREICSSQAQRPKVCAEVFKEFLSHLDLLRILKSPFSNKGFA